MISLNANERHKVSIDNENGMIVVAINGRSQSTGDLEEMVSFNLSPHNSLWLSEALKRAACQMILP